MASLACGPANSVDLPEAQTYSAVCSKVVNLTDAWLLPNGVIELQRAVDDVDENRKRIFKYRLRPDDTDCPFPMEVPTNVSDVVPSISGRHTVRVLTIDAKKTCLELWRGGSLIVRIDASQLHDKVIIGGTFGSFSWSHSEMQAVYVAERAYQERPSVFAQGGKTVLAPGRANWYREDWGEKLKGSDRLALFHVDFVHGTIKEIPGVSDDITPGQPTFWGDNIVYTGWSNGARKLGALYCTGRASKLYIVKPGSDSKEHVCLTPDLQIARAPRPSPYSNYPVMGPLAFLGSTAGFTTHTNCLELFVMETKEATPRCIVQVADIPRHGGFAGICLDSALPRQCWGDRALFFNSFLGARESVWRISINADSDSSPERVPTRKDTHPDASVALLAANETDLLLRSSTPCQPCIIYRQSQLTLGSHTVPEDCGSLPSLGSCAIVAGSSAGADVFSCSKDDIIDKIRFKVLGISATDGVGRFDAILVEPVDVPKPGLILFIHGGPHMVSTTAFNHAVAFLVQSTSCAVLLANYRGSAGFGRNALESLPGHAGTQDVDDCMAALNYTINSGDFDEQRLAVVGGSHGGFLTAHLIGQKPGVFKAAAMRNPVTNISALVTATDIPDWSFVEALGLGSYDPSSPRLPSKEELSRMWDCSPCAWVADVQTPTLIALGMMDQRVPPSQGLEYYHALRANGNDVPTRLLWYEKDCHPLDSPATDADHWVNVAMWLNEHMPTTSLTQRELVRATSMGV